MNLRQIRQLQKQGIFGKGVFGGLLSRWQQRSTSTEDLKTRLSLVFPELATNEDALTQLANANPDDFMGLGDDELRGAIGKYTGTSIRARGSAMTASTAKTNAAIKQTFGEMGEPLVEWSSEKIYNLLSKIDFNKLGDFSEGITDAVDKLHRWCE